VPPRKRKRTAKAVTRSRSSRTDSRAAALLSAVADSLNACESAGISLKLAHGAVIAEEGYVFAVGPDEAPWAVRTRTLTEFPVPLGEDLGTPVQVRHPLLMLAAGAVSLH
jgi:hypothetical protein